jgi:hypothetical protein
MYGMQNALSVWYAKCLVVQCVIQRKLRNWIENIHQVINQITPEYINSQFFDSVTGQIQPWACAPSMMAVVFQIVKVHPDITLLDKLIRAWITNRMIQRAQNHQFYTSRFSMNSHVKVQQLGFWAVLKSHGDNDPCPQFPSIVYIRYSLRKKKFIAHYFEQPAPHNYRRDTYAAHLDQMWDAIDFRFLFDGETPLYFLDASTFRNNPHEMMERMTEFLRPLWIEVSEREQPTDVPYYETPDYQMVISRVTEFIESFDDIQGCPEFAYTDVDGITEQVSAMNGVPL